MLLFSQQLIGRSCAATVEQVDLLEMNARQAYFRLAGRFCLPIMRQKLTDFLLKIAQFPRKTLLFVDDFLICGGLGIIIWTNFRVNELFGWYSLGIVLLVLGFLAMPRSKGGRE